MAASPTESERGGSSTASSGTWVFAGPKNIGGRVTAIAVDPTNSAKIWVGSVEGGLFRSTDNGVNWTPVFDGQTALSIGAVAIDPSNANILYVGTGEDNGARFTYDGEGVFKTTDGGATWTNVGLPDTRRIGKIAIDPSNSQRIFVAAGGGVYNADGNRGVYRSTDGGATWQRVLFVADNAGAIEVHIDPVTPSRVYAVFWERHATSAAYTKGGTGSGLWRSTDGGTTWTQMTSGLPATGPNIGRIGMAIAKSSPATLFADYHDASGAWMGLWKSTNSGSSWARVDNPGGIHNSLMASYGWYFAQVRVDPANANTVYLLDLYWYRSTDGGVNFTPAAAGIHVDHHDLVVGTGRLLMGNDGGFWSSTTNGTSWTHADTLPISEIYDIGIDKGQPLRRFAGLQDNGTNRTTTGGLSDWTNVLGGDGMQCEVDPVDGTRVYGESQYGAIARSTDGGTTFSSATAGIDASERTNWSTPITHDPRTSQRLYTGTIRVYRSTNGAALWTPISPDLTNGATSDLVRGTVSSIGVSPVDGNVLWAGTDDGNVWTTADGGAHWTQVNVPGVSQWVTRVTPDTLDAHSAFATFSGMHEGTYLPHIFRTTDLGAHWIDISGDLPQTPLNTVVPDPDWKGRLFAGSDIGTFLTDDWGASWTLLNGGVPPLVVQDLYIHEATRTLYAGTHGRSLYTFALSQLPPPDRDGDGVVNVDDCAPDDAGAIAPPGEVSPLTVSKLPPGTASLSWPSLASTAGSGTVYDVLRGALVPSLPVGSGAESCLAPGISGTSSSDPELPTPGTGFRYLVRARNSCGAGTYGRASSGAEELTNGCP